MRRNASISRAGFFAFLLGASLSPAHGANEAAKAELKDSTGKSIGSVEITSVRGGALLRIKASGLTPGDHGVHIHETGKCEGDFSSAGGIYNPIGSSHGYLSDEGPMAGDLPNLIVPQSGEVEVEFINAYIVLSKDADENLLDEDGASLVVFEKADDHLSDPEGDAGARIACGVLEQQK